MSTQRRLEPHQFTPYADALHICTHCDGGEYAECHVAPLPEQPTREGDEWCIGSRWHRWQEGHGYYRDITTVSGKRIYPAATEAEMNAVAEQIVTAHTRAALVPGLVAALVALEPYLSTEAELLDYASLNEGRASSYDTASIKARKALAAARKAGVE